jgi:hypothetical protein
MCALYPSYAGSIHRSMKGQFGSKNPTRPYLKAKAKRDGDMAQVVEHLLGKRKALS